MSKEEMTREAKTQEVKEMAALPQETVRTSKAQESAEPEPRGPRGVPGKRQGKVSMQIKRAWKASGKRMPLKAFAKKHRAEQTATWKANKAGKNAR